MFSAYSMGSNIVYICCVEFQTFRLIKKVVSFKWTTAVFRSQNSDWTTDWKIDVRIPAVGIFLLFSKSWRPALKNTQPPLQWVKVEVEWYWPRTSSSTCYMPSWHEQGQYLVLG